MPPRYLARMAKHPKRPRDPNQLAHMIVQLATGETGDAAPASSSKDPLAAELGRRGGLKGGRARADSLTASERREIASKAATARWKRDR